MIVYAITSIVLFDTQPTYYWPFPLNMIKRFQKIFPEKDFDNSTTYLDTRLNKMRLSTSPEDYYDEALEMYQIHETKAEKKFLKDKKGNYMDFLRHWQRKDNPDRKKAVEEIVNFHNETVVKPMAKKIEEIKKMPEYVSHKESRNHEGNIKDTGTWEFRFQLKR